MRIVNANKIYEDDVDLLKYHEVWERLPESVGPTWALRLNAGSHEGFLLVAGDCFMFVASRDGAPLPAVGSDDVLSTSRLATLFSSATLEEKRAICSFEASFGHVDGGVWRIEISTIPERSAHRCSRAKLLPGLPRMRCSPQPRSTSAHFRHLEGGRQSATMATSD